MQYVHVPKETHFDNGDYMWRWGKINGEDVIERPWYQGRARSCAKHAVSMSVYLRNRIRNLRNVGEPGPHLLKLLENYNSNASTQPETLGFTAAAIGYVDSNGERVRIDQYHRSFDFDPILMTSELVENGPFATSVHRYSHDRIVTHSGIKVWEPPHDGDDVVQLKDHAVTVIGYGYFGGILAWLYLDSYGKLTDDRLDKGKGAMRIKIAFDCLVPYFG